MGDRWTIGQLGLLVTMEGYFKTKITNVACTVLQTDHIIIIISNVASLSAYCVEVCRIKFY